MVLLLRLIARPFRAFYLNDEQGGEKSTPLSIRLLEWLVLVLTRFLLINKFLQHFPSQPPLSQWHLRKESAMGKVFRHRGKSVYVRTMLLLSAAASVIAIFAATPSAAMAGENFCGVYLQPYGQNGDRCWGMGHPLFGVTLVTYERAGCIDVANSNNELLQSWTCAAAGSAPGPAVELHFVNDGVRRKGVIRNNNLSFVGYFAGLEACYSEC